MVIAIIAVLIGLLLPAVQKVREAASRAKCQNNLKQYGLALHNYEGNNQVFPPGYTENYSTWNGVSDNSQASWCYFILPYIEQSSLFNTVNYDVARTTNAFGNSTNSTTAVVQKTKFPLLSCPSDNPNAQSAFGGGWVRGNYVGNGGIGPQTTPAGGKPPDETVEGIFYVVSKTRVADVTDGLSNTAFMSELINPNGDDMRGIRYYPEGPIYQHNNTPNSGTDNLRGAYCVNDPAAPCTGTYSSWSARSLLITARSRHPGGVQVLMGDGGVRFAQNSIGSAIWKAIATPQAQTGETVVTDF